MTSSSGDVLSSSHEDVASPFVGTGWVSRSLITLCVFLSVVASSATRRPVPSVNEPHYLCKAKHYWQPDWCSGDLFLESSNPHQVFYQTVGALTQWLTLEQSAWAGRLLALGCLSIGWTRLFLRLLKSPWQCLAAAWIFLLLQSLGNFSGEWLIGGVESKVLAYAFVFLGLADALDRRWLLTGLWTGMAISFHPIVGLWAVVAGALSAVGWIMIKKVSLSQVMSKYGRPLIGSSIVLVLTSLPGLLPAMRLLSGNDPAISAKADMLQVGERLAHHLDPARFPLESYRYYGLMLILIVLLWRLGQRTPRRDLFTGFVRATLVIALVGAMIGWGPRPLSLLPFSGTRMWLLKFYPFRLADLFVPLLLTVTVLTAAFEPSKARELTARRFRFVWLLCAAAFIVSLLLPSPDQNPSRMSASAKGDWIAACEWLRQETPTDSLVHAANENWAVKWFSHRAEYVNYKDCPQDAAGIVEWARRLKLINQWARESRTDGTISKADLATLHDETGIDYMIVSRFGPIDMKPIYSNNSFQIYDIHDE
ncbi:MAG: DUF6798 domain-containing protein [Planctomycetaceae bacterium]